MKRLFLIFFYLFNGTVILAQHDYDSQGIIYSNNSKVGVGLSNPAARLHLRSNGSESSPQFYLDDYMGQLGLKIWQEEPPVRDVHYKLSTHDNATGNLVFGVQNYNGSIRFRTGNSTTYTDRVIIDRYGRMGIGVLNPLHTLEVNGNLMLEGSGGLPLNALSDNSSNYTTKYDFKLESKNNAIYFAVSNVFNERKAFLQSGHHHTTWAHAVGEFSINPFGGNVGIGTTDPDATLTVNGRIHTREVKVDLDGAVAPDYVFQENYPLKSLDEVKTYINRHKHLPGIPSAEEMEENGIELKVMNLMLLEKVEELTLYLIRQNETIKTQAEKLENQSSEIEALKQLTSGMLDQKKN